MRPHILKADQVAHVGNLGSFLQGTLGVATGLAGAIVAVTLALLAYRIAENEKYREDFRFVNERLETAIQPLIYLARALSGVYALQITNRDVKDLLIGRAPTIGEGDNEEIDDEAPVSGYLDYKEAFSKKLEKLADALEAILLDSFSLKIFISIARIRRTQGHMFVLKELNNLKVDENVADLPQILRIWAKRLTEQAAKSKWGYVVNPRAAAMSALDGKGQKFNHAGVRDFLELGYELSQDRSGPSVLFNLTQCLPQGIADMDAVLEEMFKGTLSHELKERSPLLAFFRSENRSLWLGRSTSDAAEWIEKHGLQQYTFEKAIETQKDRARSR